MTQASKIPQGADEAGKSPAARAQRGAGERVAAAIEPVATPAALLLAGAVSAAAASALAGPVEVERAAVGSAMPVAGAEAHQSGGHADAATAAAPQAVPADVVATPAESPDTPAKLAAASITPVAQPDVGEASPSPQSAPETMSDGPVSGSAPEQVAAPAAGPANVVAGSSGPLDVAPAADAALLQSSFASIGDGLAAVMNDARQSMDATLGLAGTTLAQAERALDVVENRMAELGNSITATMDAIPAIILGAEDGPQSTGGLLAGLFGDDGEAVPTIALVDAGETVSAIAEPADVSAAIPAVADAIDLPALAMPKLGLAGLSYTDAPDTADVPVHGHSNLLHGLF